MNYTLNDNLLFLAIVLSYSFWVYRIICLIDKFCNSLDNKKEVSDENDYIRQYLDLYLDGRPNFAVFIKGSWGSGKTYFINNYKTNIKQKIYVSLFGITNKNELEFRLWKGMIFDFPNILFKRIINMIKKWFDKWFVLILLIIYMILIYWWNLSDNTKSDVLNQCFRFCKSLLIPFLSSNFVIFSIFTAIALLVWRFTRFRAMEVLLQECFLVLDDLERAEISCDIVLSWINEFVEHLHCPVIIIGNEEEIFNNIRLKYKDQQEDAIKHYNVEKEKIIGKEFIFEQDDKNVLQKLIMGLSESSDLRKTLEKDIGWFISTVLQPLKNKPYEHQTNYRVLASCFSEFEYYFNRNIIDNKEDWYKFIATDKYWKELIIRFFSFMYLKKIHSIPIIRNKILSTFAKITDNVDLEYTDSFAAEFEDVTLNKDNKIVKTFLALYPCWENYYPFLDGSDIWKKISKSKMIDEREYEWLIKMVISPESYFPPIGSIFQKWERVRDLDDGDYQQLLDETEKEFNVPTQPTLSRALRFIEKIYITFKKGYIKKWNEVQLKILFDNYIDRLFTSTEKNWLFSINHTPVEKQIFFVNRVFGKSYDKDSIVDTIKKRMLEKIEENFKEKTTRLYKSLIEEIMKNPRFFENFDNKKDVIGKDFFSYQNAEELWNVVKNLSTRDFRIILENLENHIDEYLKKSEIPFWEKFIDDANKDLVKWKSENKNIWKGDYLEKFCKDVNKIIDKYEAKSKLQLKKEDD